MQIKQLSLILISFLLIGSSIIYAFASKAPMLSFTIAFATSSIIVLASFKNYKNIVLKRLDTMQDQEADNRDTIDKIEDPYGVFDEDEMITDIKELKEQLKKEKRDKKEVAKDTLSAFTPLRVFAYVILVAGFFYLLNSGNLDLKYYIPTLIIPNITSVIYLVFFTKN